MDQYSNLNVHGKLASKNAIKLENGPDNTGVQGTDPNDVVIVSTLNTTAAGKADVDLENIEIYGTRENEKTIVWDATNSRWQYGEAGKVDAVQINGTTIAPTGSGSSRNKIANIPKAASDTLGVVKIGTNISIDSSGVISTPSVSATDSGSGNLVTGVSASGHALTVTKGVKYSTDVDGLISNGTHIVQRQSNGQITVPSTPSADTDAASKAFVNSSVGTNTATFRGTYNAVSDLGNTQATVDAWVDPPTSTIETLVAGQIATKLSSLSVTPENNDYVFVSVDQTPVGDLGEDWYWRFKYSDPNNDHTGSWGYEYTLNNSSFTQAQWDAVNSGITAAKVDKLDGIEAGAEVNVQADWNQTTSTADDYIKNKPTIGSANFKVQGQGTDASTFSANATSAVTLNIKQGGATTVTAGTNEITISSTDQSVTSSANHYSPSTASGQNKSASASGATAAWSIDVVKGVTLNTDGKGHVTGISVTSGKIPANPNTDILVKQTSQASTTTSYPLLMSAQSSPTSGTAYESKYSTSCYIKSNEVYSNGYATWNTNSLPFAATDVTLADM